jgi:Xaa-Pro aminopeptidase
MLTSDQRQTLKNRLTALRNQLSVYSLDGVIVPRFDEHQGEYCAPHDERLSYLTGFTGSAGVALVLKDKALIWVDGRYQVQIRGEVSLDDYAIEHYNDAPLENWLERHAAKAQRIGFNPMLIPTHRYRKLKAALEQVGAELVTLERDPVDVIWADQPARPLARINAFPLKHAGETSAAKRARIAAQLREAGADFMVETQPDNIAWLLNVRGGDVRFNPIPHSFLLLGADAGVEWFVDDRKLPNERQDYELDGVEVRDPGAFIGRIGARASDKAVLVDPEFASVASGLAVEHNGGRAIYKMSPVTLTKSVKNAVELQGFREAHIEDGAAWTAFMAWMHANVPTRAAAAKPVTELEAEAVILGYRERCQNFVEPSFRSISASASNAAMCHYAARPETDAAVGAAGPYLLDSGGQYYGGTTDATRTMAFGPVSDEVRSAYTAVLKGFVSIMTLQFPVGTEGHLIDAFARRALWDLGLDFDHGTGHGVGHMLSVHEHPHRIQKRVNSHKLVPGLVMTVEPGYYREGDFGMRVENQVEVVEGDRGFLKFRTLTLVPIDLSIADVGTLEKREIAFLNAYHAEVREKLMDRVPAEAREFLVRATAAI